MASGVLAKQWCGVTLPLQVLRSGAGWYIGTYDEEGPCSRESEEYWGTEREAQIALDEGFWTQRDHP